MSFFYAAQFLLYCRPLALNFFKISLCPMHVSIKLIRYEYLLVLWTFKCLIFDLLHPLVFSNIMKAILLVVYIILNNF